MLSEVSGPYTDVVCPDCQDRGVTSSIREHTRQGLKPLRTFRDEDGRIHVHEPVPILMHYECSEGHHFTREESMSCPTCGWHGGTP